MEGGQDARLKARQRLAGGVLAAGAAFGGGRNASVPYRPGGFALRKLVHRSLETCSPYTRYFRKPARRMAARSFSLLPSIMARV